MRNVAEFMRAGWVGCGVVSIDGEALIRLINRPAMMYAYFGGVYDSDSNIQFLRFVICEHCKERGKTLETLIHADAATCQEATMQRSLERL